MRMANDVQIEIIDTATPFLKRLNREFPREFRKALKSTGWWLRNEIREGIDAKAPGGQPYEPYSSITEEGILSSKRRGRRRHRRQHKPMGRLRQAVRYQYYADSNRVLIGWISENAERLGTLHEKGGEVPIKGSMRRFFWAAGVPLDKDKTHIAIPARPTIGPVYRQNAPKVPGYIEDKIWSYLRKAEAK